MFSHITETNKYGFPPPNQILILSPGGAVKYDIVHMREQAFSNFDSLPKHDP